jgi:hypothetical protein
MEMDKASFRKSRNDLLEQIKARVGHDPKFRDEFFANPEDAINKSDLAAQAALLSSNTSLVAKGCTWTCAWTD